MLIPILKGLWRKFTTPPEYNAENKHRVTRFIAEWPFTSFFMFTATKVLFVPLGADSIPYDNLTSLIVKKTGTVFIFHGILYECMPNSIFSDLTHGVIAAAMSSSPSHGVLQTCMSISRRKYPLYLIWIHNIMLTFMAYEICLKIIK